MVTANCSSEKSKPASRLKWFVNKKEVSETKNFNYKYIYKKTRSVHLTKETLINDSLVISLIS